MSNYCIPMHMQSPRNEAGTWKNALDTAKKAVLSGVDCVRVQNDTGTKVVFILARINPQGVRTCRVMYMYPGF